MSRLTWAKVKIALRGRYAAVKDWPARFPPEDVALLQWPNDKDLRGFKGAIADACAAGELAYEMADFVFPPSVAVAFTPGRRALEEDIARFAGIAPPSFRAPRACTENLPAVAAGDFVAWLRTQREMPSAHIAAWVEATAPEPAPVVLEREAPAPAPDPQRRLALLRSLGGDVKRLSGKWEVTGMAALVQHERGRPRSSEKTIRADLREAAEAERREGAQRPNWHP